MSIHFIRSDDHLEQFIATNSYAFSVRRQT